MFWLLKKTVKKETLVAEKGKDKQFYNGLIILIGKSVNYPKNETIFFLIEELIDAQKDIIPAKFQALVHHF